MAALTLVGVRVGAAAVDVVVDDRRDAATEDKDDLLVRAGAVAGQVIEAGGRIHHYGSDFGAMTAQATEDRETERRYRAVGSEGGPEDVIVRVSATEWASRCPRGCTPGPGEARAAVRTS